MRTGVTVRLAAGADEVAAAIELRREVFVDEQGVAAREELDGRDGEAIHLLAVGEDGEVLGTCRLLPGTEKVKLGRMAVSATARRRGIALRLLEAADRQARELGARRIVLGSQLSAIPLYERAGYVAHGDVFLDAGIEHMWMEKALA